MKASVILSVVAFAVATAMGSFAGMAQAQDRPASDHSTSLGQAGSDTWITTKVKTELATTKGVASSEVSVNTVDGVVTLTGVLPTRIAVNKAVAAAKSVKGVKSVDASGLKVK